MWSLIQTATHSVKRPSTLRLSCSALPRFMSSSNQEAQKNLTLTSIPQDDFGPYQEYSVIYTNRALNLMSDPFQKVMRDLNELLKVTYNADKVAIIPGSGTFGMESVARQFATNEHVMVIRNGWFSFRWTEIFDMGGVAKSHTVLKAKPVSGDGSQKQYAPYPIDDVVAKILEEKPAVLFAPHVETSTGMILPDDYIKKAADAIHQVGGLFVLDCIASGTVWADMKDLGVDVVISAPQKGWTGPCCSALVMLSEKAVAKLETTTSSSFSLSLTKWIGIMDAYVGGGFAYHTTMPTDALRTFHEISVETVKFGLPELKEAQLKLGTEARGALDSRGLVSVAAPGYEAPGVLVYYSPMETDNPTMVKKFKDQGLQIAAGVPWRIDEPDGLKTFRMGLFGLDKLGDIPKTVKTLTDSLDPLLSDVGYKTA
eukprot:Nitzschia sp. Nitz4//scaffold54_size114964//25150//26503//NITZ4_003839-RA/size114964-augustus-gene-0.16-mRNA-1//-1//CDS//3329554315//2988//frame0